MKVKPKKDIVNKDKFILDTFIKLTKRTYPFGTEDDLVKSMIEEGVFPNDLQKDSHGNYYYKVGDSRTIFASHLDTASKDATSVNHVFDGKFIKTDGKTILGADDKAGVTIMLFLMKNNIPGLYYFFVGEEVGCVGSGLAASYGDFKGKYDRIISFDRKDTNSVITFQSSIRCCSDVFANSLANELNKFGLSYKKDEGGIYTDSAEFTDIVPECTNLSVGYYKEHTTTESQDIVHLQKLANACSQIDWETLPVSRDCSKKEYRTFDYSSGWNWKQNHSTTDWRNRDYGYYDDWYYQDRNKYNAGKYYDGLDEDEDWPGQREFGKFKKNRRSNKKGKTYYDTGGQLTEISQKNYVVKDDSYYDGLIDKILDSKLSNEDLEVVKDQYLDMNNENDKKFYDYLLANII